MPDTVSTGGAMPVGFAFVPETRVRDGGSLRYQPSRRAGLRRAV